MADKESIPGVKHVVAVASGKGGVGKSTVAVNLALALRRAGNKVGLLDADITGPNVPLMMAVSGEPVADENRKIMPLMGYGVKVISIEFFVPPNTPVIWRGPMVHSAINQFLRDVNWGDLDYLILDLPPGTGDASLSVAQSIPLSGVVIVSTPQDVALLDVTKSAAMFKKLDTPIIGIIENMSFFVCPHCHGQSEIFGHGGAAKFGERYSIPLLGEIPLHPSIREGGDAGKPIMVTDPDSPQGKAFVAIAERVIGRVGELQRAGPPKPPGTPIRFFGRKS